jgi:hypothetical protein
MRICSMSPITGSVMSSMFKLHTPPAQSIEALSG